MRYEKLILFINIIVLLLCLSHAEESEFLYTDAAFKIGIHPHETILDKLPEEARQEIKQHINHINKCFYTKDFSDQTDDHIFNVPIAKIIKKYFVSFLLLKFYG